MSKSKKYELTDERHPDNPALRRIRALRDFGDVQKGDMGGYIQSEDNLSHEGTAWVCENAWVSGSALVSGNARVSGSARVYDNSWVSGSARVCGNAWVFIGAWVRGSARVGGSARVCGSARVYDVKTSLPYVLDCALYKYVVKLMESNNG